MNRPVPTLLALAIAGVALLSGCGGDSTTTSSTSDASPADDRAAIEKTWAAFADAVEKGDGDAACAELSDELARPNEFNRQLGSPVAGGPSCQDVLSDKDATLSFAAGLSPELIEVEIDGDTATAIAGAAKPTFADEDGEWKVTSVFGVLPEE